MRRALALAALAAMLAPAAPRAIDADDFAADPASLVDPLVGTAAGGNTFPGAVVPFGMLQWSPETTRGDHTRTPAPGGYEFGATRIRGFSLTHLSGTGCRGASGDVPFMPIAGAVASSPSADSTDRVYASRFAHANEQAAAGAYRVRLESGVNVELAAAAHAGIGRFTFPAGRPATLLVRVSDSEVGSSDAHVTIDSARRRISGSVTSGNFCGYLNAVDRRSYYTLHFVAVFDRPLAAEGTWHDGEVNRGATEAAGGTTYGDGGYPAAGKGSGAFVSFENTGGVTVTVRVGLSYVSEANAEANLAADAPASTSFDEAARAAHQAWNRALERIQVAGGTAAERTIFYTALYHALLHPNLFSDVTGQYAGFDGRIHSVGPRQHAQYANFSGWDVYRAQLPLVALLEPAIAGDVAQSLLNQADQNGGAWDRWTHNTGATHVMEGDPAPASIAGIVAFGGTGFDVERAYQSLARAATSPTPADASRDGCPIECVGQRPALQQWLTLHYIPAGANAWGGAGETLEDAAADFSLAQLARRLARPADADVFEQRSRYWRNLFNAGAAADGGYVQDRTAEGAWPRFDPASSDGFAEGSSAQYTWMVPFDADALAERMGGRDRAIARLTAFFHNPDGSWALTGLGGLHAELDNEPSTGAPWMFDLFGRPDLTESTVRAAMTALWHHAPTGIPGNDDLGAMSAWYVWSALGLYPAIPGRATLFLGSPLFPRTRIARANGVTMAIEAPAADAGRPFVSGVRLDGRAVTAVSLPEEFVGRGGRLEFALAASAPEKSWIRER